MADIVRFLLEDILGDAFAGLFRTAKTPQSRRWKVAGWKWMIASTCAFILSAFLPLRNGFEWALCGGLLAGLATFGCGFWASVENLHHEQQPPENS